jgi:DNA-binding response OmpR family regulator
MELVKPFVLVVDDEPVIANTLAEILNRSGYRAVTAHNAEAALELALSWPPQVLITDVVLPGENGIDLAMSIRRIFPDCKMLLFSGQAHTRDILALPKYQGHDFDIIGKPIHPSVLLDRVKKALSAKDGII